MRRGNPSIDLGYFLQGACTIETRRAAERDLVEEYCAALELPADDRPSTDDVWLRYRAAAAFVDLDAAIAIEELVTRTGT